VKNMNEAQIKQRLEEIQIRMRFLESGFGVKESQVVSFDKLDKSAYWQIVQEYENEVRQKIRSVAKEMKAEKEKRRTPLYDRRIAAAAERTDLYYCTDNRALPNIGAADLI